mmetsp:Transcript_28372/g.42973  ORF Transcript_28372/g.42973 Transcript_28372/m.42973 type:complete len:88 (+) Transcript_28372:995-1258(+)
MSFCMALINEDGQQYGVAIKFLKRFYFCAKLLEDHEGTEIALNKIGICFFMAGEFLKAFHFHKRQGETTLKNPAKINDDHRMVSFYN